MNTRITLCAVLFIAAACGSDPEDPQMDDHPRLLEAPPQPLTVKSAGKDAVPADPRLRPVMQLAKQDLAAMLNAKLETIDVVEARYVTWADSSLGCPRPDFEYMQVLTDGVLIVLSHDGAFYYYHGSREGRPFYCKEPQKPLVGQPGEASR